jgi:hypothetical protein
MNEARNNEVALRRWEWEGGAITSALKESRGLAWDERSVGSSIFVGVSASEPMKSVTLHHRRSLPRWSKVEESKTMAAVARLGDFIGALGGHYR